VLTICIILQDKNQESRDKLNAHPTPFNNGALNEDDKVAARTLSDNLNLDEELCVRLLVLAHDEGRPASVEHAASIYFEERRNLLLALVRMLQIFLGYVEPSDAAFLDLVTAALKHLVKIDRGESRRGSSLFTRLCAIATVRYSHYDASSALPPLLDLPLPICVTEYHQA
jgi:hypothetical protein